jgi:DhnA family fructose-bisphosphate aldolase class Ia
MDARTGKAIRINRIFNPEDGKALINAYSHSVIYGPIKGAENQAQIRKNLELITAELDAVILNPGSVSQLEDLFYGKDKASLIIQIDYQNYSRKKMIPYDEGSAVSLFTIEDALKAGADAVMSYLYIGSEDPEREALEIRRNRNYVSQSRKYGLPLIIEPRFAREAVEPEKKYDLELLKFYTRIAQDIGADMIKMIYPANDHKLAEIAELIDIPILIAGGENRGEARTISNARRYLENGASGLIFGRSIFQSENMQELIKKLKRIVHP